MKATSKHNLLKDKFKKERQLLPVIAKTNKQQKYLDLLYNSSVQVVCCLGLHGTGKTYLASLVAADYLRQNRIEKIIVARPYIQTGKASGYKPGSSLDKLYPYVRNVLDTIKNRIGSSVFDIALKDGLKGSIEVQELESIRGRSFDQPSWLIVDEAQQSTKEEMLAIITRISDNTKLILCGDINQKDIKTQSGLEWFLNFTIKNKLNSVGVINFDSPDDIVRGKFAKEVAIALSHLNKGE